MTDAEFIRSKTPETLGLCQMVMGRTAVDGAPEEVQKAARLVADYWFEQLRKRFPGAVPPR